MQNGRIDVNINTAINPVDALGVSQDAAVRCAVMSSPNSVNTKLAFTPNDLYKLSIILHNPVGIDIGKRQGPCPLVRRLVVGRFIARSHNLSN